MSDIEIPNVAEMVEAGYCISPNNIWSLPGVVMYAAGPGVMEPLNTCLMDINVSAEGVALVVSRWRDGKFVGLDRVNEFPDARAYLEWVAIHGKKSLPGLPPYSNSWD